MKLEDWQKEVEKVAAFKDSLKELKYNENDETESKVKKEIDEFVEMSEMVSKYFVTCLSEIEEKKVALEIVKEKQRYLKGEKARINERIKILRERFEELDKERQRELSLNCVKEGLYKVKIPNDWKLEDRFKMKIYEWPTMDDSEKSLALFKRIESLNKLMTNYVEQDKGKLGVEKCLEEEQMMAQEVGEDHPFVGCIASITAQMYLHNLQPAEARRKMQGVLLRRRFQFGWRHEIIAVTLAVLAKFYKETLPHKAVNLATEALNIFKTNNSNKCDIAHLRMDIGEYLIKDRRHMEAKEMLDKAIEEFDDPEQKWCAMALMVSAYLGNGDLEDAEELAKKVLNEVHASKFRENDTPLWKQAERLEQGIKVKVFNVPPLDNHYAPECIMSLMNIYTIKGRPKAVQAFNKIWAKVDPTKPPKKRKPWKKESSSSSDDEEY